MPAAASSSIWSDRHRKIGEQLLVHDTVTAQDRTVAVLASGEFSNIAITDDGRYILYYDGSTSPHSGRAQAPSTTTS